MAHDLVTELLQYSSLACFMPIWQLCANLLIPNCLRSNLSYSPLAALELYVKSCKTKVLRDFFYVNLKTDSIDLKSKYIVVFICLRFILAETDTFFFLCVINCNDIVTGFV